MISLGQCDDKLSSGISSTSFTLWFVYVVNFWLYSRIVSLALQIFNGKCINYLFQHTKMHVMPIIHNSIAMFSLAGFKPGTSVQEADAMSLRHAARADSRLVWLDLQHIDEMSADQLSKNHRATFAFIFELDKCGCLRQFSSNWLTYQIKIDWIGWRIK
jgi:hypothetical protein